MNDTDLLLLAAQWMHGEDGAVQAVVDATLDTLQGMHHRPDASMLVGLDKSISAYDSLLLKSRAGTSPAKYAAINQALEGDVPAKSLQALKVARLQAIRSQADAYQAAVASALSIPGDLGSQVDRAKVVLNKLQDQGITGFTDKGGRNWSLAAYAEMATRAGMQRVEVSSRLSGYLAKGRTHVIVSDAPEECPICRLWEGRVLSIATPAQLSKVDAATAAKIQKHVPTVEEAMAAGFMHPGCRHDLRPYLGPEASPDYDDRQKMKDPEGDKARTKQRYLERQVRRMKRHVAAEQSLMAHGVPHDPKWGVRLAAAQKKLNDHVEQNGLKSYVSARRTSVKTAPGWDQAKIDASKPAPKPTPTSAQKQAQKAADEKAKIDAAETAYLESMKPIKGDQGKTLDEVLQEAYNKAKAKDLVPQPPDVAPVTKVAIGDEGEGEAISIEAAADDLYAQLTQSAGQFKDIADGWNEPFRYQVKKDLMQAANAASEGDAFNAKAWLQAAVDKMEDGGIPKTDLPPNVTVFLDDDGSEPTATGEWDEDEDVDLEDADWAGENPIDEDDDYDPAGTAHELAEEMLTQILHGGVSAKYYGLSTPMKDAIRQSLKAAKKEDDLLTAKAHIDAAVTNLHKAGLSLDAFPNNVKYLNSELSDEVLEYKQMLADIDTATAKVKAAVAADPPPAPATPKVGIMGPSKYAWIDEVQAFVKNQDPLLLTYANKKAVAILKMPDLDWSAAGVKNIGKAAMEPDSVKAGKLLDNGRKAYLQKTGIYLDPLTDPGNQGKSLDEVLGVKVPQPEPEVKPDWQKKAEEVAYQQDPETVNAYALQARHKISQPDFDWNAPGAKSYAQAAVTGPMDWKQAKSLLIKADSIYPHKPGLPGPAAPLTKVAEPPFKQVAQAMKAHLETKPKGKVHPVALDMLDIAAKEPNPIKAKAIYDDAMKKAGNWHPPGNVVTLYKEATQGIVPEAPKALPYYADLAKGQTLHKQWNPELPGAKEILEASQETDPWKAHALWERGIEKYPKPLVKKGYAQQMADRKFAEEAAKAPTFEAGKPSSMFKAAKEADLIAEYERVMPPAPMRPARYGQQAGPDYPEAQQLEYRALRSYTGSGYTGMNDYLRGYRNSGSVNIKSAIDAIDRAMARSAAPSDMLVHRNVNAGAVGLPDNPTPADLNGLVGQTIKDKGFVSTSIKKQAAEKWGRKVMLNIEVPKGTQGIYVRPLSDHKSEWEFLLPRGTSMVVKKVVERQGAGYMGRVVEVTVQVVKTGG